ncbi:hypothetical protein WDU94_003591 [Cyamophila willieti]
MFADDCALIAENPEDLQEIQNVFTNEAEKFGLNVNQTKTEVMFINTPPKDIKLKNEIVKTVTEFKYLGSLLQHNGYVEKEINHRINAASQAFQKLYSRVWKRHEINLKTKLLVYQTIVLSTLLYSSETWTILEKT